MDNSINLKMQYSPPTKDFSGGSAYLRLEDGEIKSAYQTSIIPKNLLGEEKGTLIFDFDNEGRLLGIEFMGAADLLPQSLLNTLE